MGFITKAKLGVNHAITDCDFKLYQHGEEHNPPTDYGFTFWAGNLKKIYIRRDYRRNSIISVLRTERRIGDYFKTHLIPSKF